MVQECNNNLMKDMMQEYNNDQIIEDTTANDVVLNTHNSDNND